MPLPRVASDGARLLVRPFAGYAALRDDVPSLAGGLARLLVVIGVFVAFTATGRLAPFELASATVSFAYVPLVQAGAVATALRLAPAATRPPLRDGFALYLAGHAPWLLFLLTVAGACLFSPVPARTVLGAALPLVVVVACSGVVLTFAFFRAGLGLSRRRAALATATFYAVTTACVLAYFVAAGQLLPILPA